MNTAVNQSLTAKLAEMYPFKRTQRLEPILNQAAPSKVPTGGIYSSTLIVVVVTSGIH